MHYDAEPEGDQSRIAEALKVFMTTPGFKELLLQQGMGVVAKTPAPAGDLTQIPAVPALYFGWDGI